MFNDIILQIQLFYKPYGFNTAFYNIEKQRCSPLVWSTFP